MVIFTEKSNSIQTPSHHSVRHGMDKEKRRAVCDRQRSPHFLSYLASHVIRGGPDKINATVETATPTVQCGDAAITSVATTT